ncbi:hypothetical protein, partial [Dubosiella newyorkensis]|uniref:hypothetical protein n=1 Tax=Dubosiella newyorkensis TaxID=1862672 RepID=UPI0023F29EBC
INYVESDFFSCILTTVIRKERIDEHKRYGCPKKPSAIRSLPDSCGAVEKNKGIHVNSVKDI